MGPQQTLSWHAKAPRVADGEAGPLLCHSPDTMTSRGGQRAARPRDTAAGGRDVPKYLPPRWPAECQVACEAFRHLSESPSEWEQYYTPSGEELTPPPVGHELGRIVFQYKPDEITRVFSKSCPERLLEPNCVPDDIITSPAAADEPDGVLQFESRFESGNLQEAVHVSGNYYELRMRTDLYTERHTQWFYFRVRNTRAGELYRFSVTNFARCSTLYSCGQRPLMYSVAAAQRSGTGWRRAGDQLAYYPARTNRSTDGQETTEQSFVLSFTLEFPYDDDTVFLASGLPYTFSALQDHLRAMQADPFISSICHQRVLCRSLAGNPVFLLTITSPDMPTNKSRRAVVLTARVHPAETQASWMMRGILNFLTSRDRVAEMLRQKFVFKIVPMLNPDGVIVGNARCSLAGRDMNRQFKHTHRDLYPAVWHLKLLVRRLMEESGVTVYCDFHGHSRRQNAFIYGCENRRNSSRYLTEKVFPFLLDRVARNLFAFDSCQFSVHKSKEGTGRVVMWSMGITNAYTLEASSAGSSLRARAGTHYRAHDYEMIGQRFCETLLDYVDTSPIKERVRERVMDTLREQYGYTEPAEGSESSSGDDSGDEAGSGSKTKKAGKKWQSKKIQSLMSWKKKGKPQQTLTKITLRPPSERSLISAAERSAASPPTPPLAAQVKEVASGATRPAQSPSLTTPGAVVGRTVCSPSRPVSPAVSTRCPVLPSGRPVSARPVCPPASPGRSQLLAPPQPPARARSLSLDPESAQRCRPPSACRLTVGTPRLSLRLGPQPRVSPATHGQLPNSPLRAGHPGHRGRRLVDRTTAAAAAATGRARDTTAPPPPPRTADSDVIACDVTSQNVTALRGLTLGNAPTKQSEREGGGTAKKKKTKVKKGRKVKVKARAK